MYHISVCILLVGMGLAPFKGYTQKEPSPSQGIGGGGKKTYSLGSDVTLCQPFRQHRSKAGSILFSYFHTGGKSIGGGSAASIYQMGNLLLLVNQDMWMQIHGTSQPIRITPLPRLRRFRILSDLARLSWTRIHRYDGKGHTGEPF